MSDDEVQQFCPFCFEKWGDCQHFEMMEALEKEADLNEQKENLSEPGQHDDKT